MDLSWWPECKPDLSFCNPTQTGGNVMDAGGGRDGADAYSSKNVSKSKSSLPSKSERR